MVLNHRMESYKLTNDSILLKPSFIFIKQIVTPFSFYDPSSISIGRRKIEILLFGNSSCEPFILRHITLHDYINTTNIRSFKMKQKRFTIAMNLKRFYIST